MGGMGAVTVGGGGNCGAQPNPRMYLAIMIAMTGAIMFGLDQGNFGNVQSFQTFRDEWCVGRYGDEVSCGEDGAHRNARWQNIFVLWGASLITFSAAIGGLVLGPTLTGNYGRRPCISVGSAICLVGCLLSSYLSFRSEALFFLGRFLTGFGIGVCCFALPLYNAEIATPAIRGATGSLFQFNVVIGAFAATVVTLVDRDWRFGMLLPGIAGALVATAVWLTPESPRFVMNKHGYEAGVAELRKVRRGDVALEAHEMREQIELERETRHVTYTELFTNPSLRKRLLIACWLQVAQQLTGVNAFLGYASTLFKDVGVENPYLFNMVWNAVMIAGCVLGLLFVDSRYGGRRIQLLGATWLMGPALIVAGVAVALKWPGVISMVMVCAYGAGFQFAWGTVPWIYPAEIFTMAEKERAVSLAVFLQYIANAAVVVLTPVLMSVSVPGTLFAFGVLNVLNMFFVLACIRETKGIDLELIPALFGDAAAPAGPKGGKGKEAEDSEDGDADQVPGKHAASSPGHTAMGASSSEQGLVL